MKKIVIVEDTPDLLVELADILMMEGYDVRPFGKGSEALLQLDKIRPDLIVTDLSMPDMDGFKFIQKVRDQMSFRAVPVIIFSARPKEENQPKALALNVDAYLEKPCDPEKLLDQINTIFSKKS
jgi:DNA-binding response OmpR family regulator